MREEIKLAFDALRARHADSRFALLDVELEEQPGRLLARGRVLDDATRADLRAALQPFHLDDSAVVTLRQAQPALLSAATNLTDLLAGPTWLSERLSQLLAGQRLEILETRERWVFARQVDGYLGWAYLPYLTDETPLPPTHVVGVPVVLLRGEHVTDAAVTGRVLCGTLLRVIETRDDWARVKVFAGAAPRDAASPARLDGGWLPLEELRALDDLPRSANAMRAQMLRDAVRFMGVPYLWGGSSVNGIDCSGFVQLLHALVGIRLPRDADLQFAAGRPVEPPYQPGDLLFYGDGTDEKRSITHVSMSLGGWDIIHSSRRRNGVAYDNVQAVDGLRETFAGACSFLPE